MKKIQIYFFGMFLFAFALNATASKSSDEILPQDQSVQKDTVPTEPKEKVVLKPVKNTFDGTFIIDNQTCMVPFKNTFEADIQHRFGTMNNGKSDGFGLFAPANIRLGLIYTPIKNLSVGFGLTKERITFDFNAKYSIIQQSEKGGWPVSVTYFGVIGLDGRPKPGNFVTEADRYSFFNQLMIARKITEKLSVQMSVSLSYFNNVEGIIKDSVITPKMKNANFSMSFFGRYKITEKTAIILNYDQPLTQNLMNNPHPNVSFGVELSSAGHTFQIFFGNYQSIVPQYNNMYNQNDFTKSNYLLGFNITRKWHFSK